MSIHVKTGTDFAHPTSFCYPNSTRVVPSMMDPTNTTPSPPLYFTFSHQFRSWINTHFKFIMHLDPFYKNVNPSFVCNIILVVFRFICIMLSPEERPYLSVNIMQSECFWAARNRSRSRTRSSGWSGTDDKQEVS